jgi:putative lipoprotein
MATIQVEAFYRERMMVPPNAQLRVTLSDVSKMDVAAQLITEVVVDNPGAPPYNIGLNYDPEVIDQRMRYAVRGTISADDKLMFTSTEHIDAFAPDDSGVVKVTMQRVSSATKNAQSLTDGHWQLVALNGVAATPGAGGKKLFLQLRSEDSRYHGFSGCNNYSGSFSRDGGHRLTLGPGASTRMACAEGMEQEHTYLSILSLVASYRIDGKSLSLLDSEAKVLASFESTSAP